ncbi:hypothetical protein ACM43_05225 [Bradyrhizobium sp. CCBAU 45321]|nr:hypothetical protein [Bradyrhizobium sp. CCBAU 45321]
MELFESSFVIPSFQCLDRLLDIRVEISSFDARRSFWRQLVGGSSFLCAEASVCGFDNSRLIFSKPSRNVMLLVTTSNHSDSNFCIIDGHSHVR